MALENLADLEAEWAEFMFDRPGPKSDWSQDQRWRSDNPGKRDQLLAYRSGGARPAFSAAKKGSPELRMRAHIDAWLKAKGTTEPEPEPQPGNGSKLVLPSVYNSPPSGVFTPSGPQFGGQTDKVIKIPQGLSGQQIVGSGNFTRCIFDFTGTKMVGNHNYLKIEGDLTDCIIRGMDATKTPSIGFLSYGNMTRVLIHKNKMYENAPNYAFGNKQNFHCIYLGSHGIARHVTIIDNRFIKQRSGFGVHFYDGYDYPGAGGYDCVVAFNTFVEVGIDTDSFETISIIHATGGKVIAHGNVAERCPHQLAGVPDWSGAGPLQLSSNAEVGQTGPDSGDYHFDGEAPGSNVNIPGDPGYRMPYDTRTSGIGAFTA